MYIPDGSLSLSTKYRLESETGSTAKPGKASTGQIANNSPAYKGTNMITIWKAWTERGFYSSITRSVLQFHETFILFGDDFESSLPIRCCKVPVCSSGVKNK